MAVDWIGGERERLAHDLPVDDIRGLLADRQSTRYALSLDLELEHELLSGHSGALPSAGPRKPGVLAGSERQGEARRASCERRIDCRRDRASRRADDRDYRHCQSTFHLDTSLFRNLAAVTPGKPSQPAVIEDLARDFCTSRAIARRARLGQAKPYLSQRL